MVVGIYGQLTMASLGVSLKIFNTTPIWAMQITYITLDMLYDEDDSRRHLNLDQDGWEEVVDECNHPQTTYDMAAKR